MAMVKSFNDIKSRLAILLCFVEAHCDLLGPLLRLFMKDLGMNDCDYTAIHDQISEWLQRQLAASNYPLVHTLFDG